MTRFDFILPFSVGVIGSIISIFAAYTDYSMISYDLGLAFERVQKWRWFWVSVGFTSFSCLFPFFAYYFYAEEERVLEHANAYYAFGALWIPILVVYPGAILGESSDRRLIYAVFGISVFQYFTTKLLTRKIVAENEQKA